jgi:hypothetical protein
MTNIPKCETCPFHQTVKPSTASPFGHHECRAHGPSPGFGFPHVNNTDWCAEHPSRADYHLPCPRVGPVRTVVIAPEADE